MEIQRLLRPKKIVESPIYKLQNVKMPNTNDTYYDLYKRDKIKFLDYHQMLIDTDKFYKLPSDSKWAIENIELVDRYLVKKLYQELFDLMKKIFIPKIFMYDEEIKGKDLMDVYDNHHCSFIRLLENTHKKNNNYLNEKEPVKEYYFNLKINEVRKILKKIDLISEIDQRYNKLY